MIARAESPWRSTVRQQANHITRPPSPRHDGLSRPSLALSPRNDKERVVTEPTPSFPTTLSSRERKPVAIRCEPLSTQNSPNAFIKCGGLRGRPLSFISLNDKKCAYEKNNDFMLNRAYFPTNPGLVCR
ncbi:MAG: hypothetical protein HN754_00330 [Opitutae bacterium]|nr:hypothetical protein [Opitutae bacterium]